MSGLICALNLAKRGVRSTVSDTLGRFSFYSSLHCLILVSGFFIFRLYCFKPNAVYISALDEEKTTRRKAYSIELSLFAIKEHEF